MKLKSLTTEINIWENKVYVCIKGIVDEPEKDRRTPGKMHDKGIEIYRAFGPGNGCQGQDQRRSVE